MSNEIKGVTSADKNVYALIANSAGKFWNGSSFETYVTANYANYLITLTEQGTSSGIYFGDFPTGITSSGTYEYFVRRQNVTGTNAETDPTVNAGKIDWTGSVVVSAASGAMLGSEFYAYLLRYGFKRDDKETEAYEAITDAVQEMRRRFEFEEAQAETSSTDTIASLGDFQIGLESDHGLLVGVVLQDGYNAHPLTQVTKAHFNDLYPDIAVTNDRGYPQHFCVYAGAIEIGPVPDQTSYTYKIAYSRRGGTITSTSSVPFSQEYRDVLVSLSLSRLYEMLEEFPASQYHRQRFEEAFMYAKRREALNKGEGTFVMRPFTV